jgi:3-methyladenine DNA glycosylase Tag
MIKKFRRAFLGYSPEKVRRKIENLKEKSEYDLQIIKEELLIATYRNEKLKLEIRQIEESLLKIKSSK